MYKKDECYSVGTSNFNSKDAFMPVAKNRILSQKYNDVSYMYKRKGMYEFAPKYIFLQHILKRIFRGTKKEIKTNN